MDSRANLAPLPNRRALLVIGAAGVASTVAAPLAWADDASDLVRDARRKLDKLLAADMTARRLNARARAVLVFPTITKAGFIVGAENGQGVMFMGPSVVGFFQITGGSFGLQFGAQTYGLALFFMNQQAINYLRRNKGFSIGAGPSVTAVDQGVAKGLSTTTGLQDIYAEAFDQRGLMASVSIQGSKISEISPPH
jgi:lipid-binding SYLF domain-containing protein